MSGSTSNTEPDVNFCFPVRELENDRAKLTPFILYEYLPFGPFASAADYTKELIEGRIAPNPGIVLFAIIDKTRSPSPSAVPSSVDFAGTIGFLNASPLHLSTEIGFIIVLPPFQRTHVATNAFGLLLHYALDLPSASPPGLGLRRVQWQANAENSTSIKVAEKMGLKKEAVLRWDRVLPEGKGKVGNGKRVRGGDPRSGAPGRDTVMLATYWDDWEGGGKEKVEQLMDR
ncbi:hypothetical protein HYDPIDRAFT_169134 [Hydnomerulius pinastri MD-312]|uniref:N-acetyltransferase domain-containing protein n=1 Tax=Hydnomerulius pinastri MD-312 TaxID=994086 RepID=A0A0C9WCV3_9AGAM|nr:hypothetical protein HYDPIDRAFT_169134 [Hydnomerulius pinastri MD-312]